MQTFEPKREALEKLIQICRAGRAGRNLALVPAFAELEAELVAKRDSLPPPPESVTPQQSPALANAA